MLNDSPHIAIVGLGYVGLPLAVEFGKHYPTIGFDIDAARIDALRRGFDRTREVDSGELAASTRLSFNSDPEMLRQCNVYIVTVPTPIDEHKRPDFGPLIAASTTVGRLLDPGDLVIYESTVYPGATEEVCVPILEHESGLDYLGEKSHGTDPGTPDPVSRMPDGHGGFHVGYSPERINPGDRKHRLVDIRKVTAGSNPAAAERVDALYAGIITAGTHRAPGIRVAEAAKVIENTQRDVNIALVNELAMLFDRLGIDTGEVLEAAGTKWNFLPFRPGLVGGHCIGVDPYYLTHKAQAVGHHPEMILAGRRINDGMGAYVAGRLIKTMIRRRLPLEQARVLILGLTFKENCPDLRNTRVVDVIRELRDFTLQVDVHDPWVDPVEAEREYGIHPVERPEPGSYDAVVLAVAHREFAELGAAGIRAFGKPKAVLYDVKGLLPVSAVDGRL
jgi:UDP-N-acetyl-D-galactosamine dehydrogenase